MACGYVLADITALTGKAASSVLPVISHSSLGKNIGNHTRHKLWLVDLHIMTAVSSDK
jgi:hypothetical protein